MIFVKKRIHAECIQGTSIKFSDLLNIFNNLFQNKFLSFLPIQQYLEILIAFSINHKNTLTVCSTIRLYYNFRIVANKCQNTIFSST